jgi:hypothetical protein
LGTFVVDRFWRILLQKSKIEQLQKSRESRFLDISAAAMPCSADTKVRGLFWVNQCGPSRRPARNASAALKIFAVQPKKTFSTLSAQSGHSMKRRSLRSFDTPSQARAAQLFGELSSLRQIAF